MFFQISFYRMSPSHSIGNLILNVQKREGDVFGSYFWLAHQDIIEVYDTLPITVDSRESLRLPRAEGEPCRVRSWGDHLSAFPK